MYADDRLEDAPRERRTRLQRDCAEKQIDILQKALRHHPGSDEILLPLLRASKLLQDDAEMKLRWQVYLYHVALQARKIILRI